MLARHHQEPETFCFAPRRSALPGIAQEGEKIETLSPGVAISDTQATIPEGGLSTHPAQKR